MGKLVCAHPIAQINVGMEPLYHICVACGKGLTDKDLDDRDKAARLVGETPWLNDTWSKNANR